MTGITQDIRKKKKFFTEDAPPHQPHFPFSVHSWNSGLRVQCFSLLQHCCASYTSPLHFISTLGNWVRAR